MARNRTRLTAGFFFLNKIVVKFILFIFISLQCYMEYINCLSR